MNKEIKPLLHNKKNTLISKKVAVKGTNDFSVDIPELKTIASDTSSKNSSWKQKANKTSKMSPATILKLNLIQSFISQPSGKNKKTIDTTTNQLVDAYIENVLSSRQRETFKQLYDMQYNELQK